MNKLIIFTFLIILAGCSSTGGSLFCGLYQSRDLTYSEFHDVKCISVIDGVCIENSSDSSLKIFSDLLPDAQNISKEDPVVAFKSVGGLEATFTVGSYRHVSCMGDDGGEHYLVYVYNGSEWAFKEKIPGPLWCLG